MINIWLSSVRVDSINSMLALAEAAGLLPEQIEPARDYLRESQRLLKAGNADAAIWAVRAAWERANFLRAGAEEKTEIRAGRANVNAHRKSNVKRSVAASKQHNDWQKFADDIWKRHPKKSKVDVAGMIAAEHGGNPNTIRRGIKKLS